MNTEKKYRYADRALENGNRAVAALWSPRGFAERAIPPRSHLLEMWPEACRRTGVGRREFPRGVIKLWKQRLGKAN